MAVVDLTNQRYGKLVVIERAGSIVRSPKDGKRTAWLCKCDCGKTKIVTGHDLKNGHISSCGCLQGNRDSLMGQTFGRLTVVDYMGVQRSTISGHTDRYWKCRCSCGNETIKPTHELRSGKTSSCGCFRLELGKQRATTHGLSKTKLYHIFLSMKARCYRPTAEYYENYGGRGIKICEEWMQDYMVFHHWAMTHGYKEGLTIERINNDGNYEPDNCKWIPFVEQAKNTRRVHRVVYKGKQMVLSDLCKLTQIAPQTIKKYEAQFNYDYDLLVKYVLGKPEHNFGRAKKRR